MPDSAEPQLIPVKDRLKPGRRPAWLEPIIPFRIEEWGKSAAYVVPPGWSPRPDGSNLPTVRRRGRPGLGTIAVYVGENAMTPRPEFLPKEYRTMKVGYAYTEQEAHARANAWIRAHMLSSGGKARRRAKARQVAGARTTGSDSASPATSASHAGKPGI